MRTKLFILLTAFLFIAVSCKKDVIQNEKIEGDWRIVEAYEIDGFGDEEDVLYSYSDVIISFIREDSFVWTEDNLEYEGKISKKGDVVTLSFNDGEVEEWIDFNHRKNKNSITYTVYTNDDYEIEFKLQKEVVGTTRRI